MITNNNKIVLEKVEILFDENEATIVKDFGLDKRGNLCVISEDIGNTIDYFREETSRGEVLILDSQEYICCDSCQKVVPIHESHIIKEDEIICDNCNKDLSC